MGRHAYSDRLTGEIPALGTLCNIKSDTVNTAPQWHLLVIDHTGIEDSTTLLWSRMDVNSARPERTVIGVIHRDLQCSIRNVPRPEVSDAIFSGMNLIRINMHEDERCKSHQNGALCT
jgi:hypothetical protein